ncbi:hypothetical protein RHMOL_Rhmol04G0292700 [Rhododendron molle]|uniref:Uncharacterized protein n=1 Tax=Rhododendron molle TaxID=49168 RepID=A0ACC0P7D0_RHOML|nr:hypothetical protein RHMOL_Rhmol04G0292700 [Rhododendron molle]
MDIELGHNNFCEITRVETVMMADGRGVVRMVAPFAWMLMAVTSLDCGDPVAPFWRNARRALWTVGVDKEMHLKEAVESLQKIELELIKGKSKFFGGETIGYLDIALEWISYWLPVLEEVGSMTIADPIQFPAIAGWTENFSHHPMVKDKLPPRDEMVVYYQRKKKETEAQVASARKG